MEFNFGGFSVRLISWLSILGLLASCASSGPTADPNTDYIAAFQSRVNTASKNDLVTDYGGLEWCKPDGQTGETCRFYYRKGKGWQGKERFKKAVEFYDQIDARFDQNGILKTFTYKNRR